MTDCGRRHGWPLVRPVAIHASHVVVSIKSNHFCNCDTVTVHVPRVDVGTWMAQTESNSI